MTTDAGAARSRPTFDEAFDVLWRPMVRLAATLVDEPAAAEDVAQDAFARAMLRWHTIDDPATYLRRAIVNRARSELRRRGVRRRPMPAPPAAPSGEPILVDDALMAALRGLSPKRRAVVALRFYEDLPEAQIARVLGIRLGTVKSTLHTALAQLRKELEP